MKGSQRKEETTIVEDLSPSVFVARQAEGMITPAQGQPASDTEVVSEAAVPTARGEGAISF